VAPKKVRKLRGEALLGADRGLLFCSLLGGALAEGVTQIEVALLGAEHQPLFEWFAACGVRIERVARKSAGRAAPTLMDAPEATATAESLPTAEEVAATLAGECTLLVHGLGMAPPLQAPEALDLYPLTPINLLMTSWLTHRPGSALEWRGPRALRDALAREVRLLGDLECGELEGGIRVHRPETAGSVAARAGSVAGAGSAASIPEIRLIPPHPGRRDHLLLQAMLAGKPLALRESWSSWDQLPRLFATLGAPLAIRHSGLQELDEFQKRLARMGGQRPEKEVRYDLAASAKMGAGKVRLPADVSQAAYLATIALLLPGSEITLPQVLVTPSRAGIFAALRRLGADLEPLRRKEWQGEIVADLRVRPSGALSGSRFHAESLQNSLEEYPFLAIVAAKAKGESVLRGLAAERDLAEAGVGLLARNLRSAGIEVGDFEDGLVLRGREELDAADFDAGETPALALALEALSLAGHGKSQMSGHAILDRVFPGRQSLLEELSREN